MIRIIKLVLPLLVLGLLGWWGINNLQPKVFDFFYQRELIHNPKILSAQANQTAFEERTKVLKPLRDQRTADLNIAARSAVSFLVKDSGQEMMLFQKQIDKPLPIASLTKLMTALVVLKNYDLGRNITVSQEAVQQEEDLGRLTVGQTLSVETLLYPLLMESSNDAAFSLANDYPDMNQTKFVGLMNSQAQKLGMSDTYFSNESGLDSENSEPSNYSTARDLVVLVQALLDEPLIWQILGTAKINLYGVELISTNQLLEEMPHVIGGKTGYTEEALGCFLLVLKPFMGHQYAVNVILGTGNGRFTEMAKLVDWNKKAYQW